VWAGSSKLKRSGLDWADGVLEWGHNRLDLLERSLLEMERNTEGTY
jgi:hypothetical protein